MSLKHFFIILATGTVCAMLNACSEPERLVFKADEGQIGSDATITMEGKSGRIRFRPLYGYPNGMDEKVTEIERIPSPDNRSWQVKTENNMTISFQVVNGAYICDSCFLQHLPLTWHPQKQSR